MKPSSDEIALNLWNDVLASMPSEYHRGRALVEARRRIIGEPQSEQIFEALDRLAVEAFGPDQVSDTQIPTSGLVTRRPLGEDQIRRAVIDAVSDGFAATTDGSQQRAQALRARALGNARRVIAQHRKDLSWLARWRLMSEARKVANKEMRAIIE